MNKLDELLNSDKYFTGCYSLMLPIKEEIKEFAIAYAEWYAKQCLEIAANKVKPTTKNIVYKASRTSLVVETVFIIDVDSILNIKLPEHE